MPARVGPLTAATLLIVVSLMVDPTTATSDASREWHYYGADAANTRYSPLDQIDSTNVEQLRMVWRWRTPDYDLRERQLLKQGASPHEATPLMVNGALYVNSPLNYIAALDPATGEEIWNFNPEGWRSEHYWSALRGIAHWSDGERERILFGTGTAYLYSLDAHTGEPDLDFGEGGRVDLTKGLARPSERSAMGVTSPPIVCRDVVVIGGYANDEPGHPPELTGQGDVRGYDVHTGELLWTFHTVPREGEFGTDTWENDSWKTAARTNVWSVMSADEELGYVYLPVGTPDNDYYGGSRHGDNLFSSSLVCLDARTGERIWHYQIMRHAGWNLDLAHAPMLVDVEVDGTPVKAVAQITKQAFCFVFDRVTGEPIWPIHDRPVPQSTVPGEKLAPTQPFPTRPLAFDRQGLDIDDLIDFSPELRDEAIEIVGKYDYGPIYNPPSLRGYISMPYMSAAWWNGAAHPGRGWIYVSSRSLPYRGRIWEAGEDDGGQTRYTGSNARQLTGPRGLPLLKPPYGRITAIDLNTGEHRWMTPVGRGPADHPDLRDLDLPVLGSTARHHVMATGSLLFTASSDPREADKHWPDYYTDPEADLRAYDLDDGHLVARIRLPAHAWGCPMTYMVEGRQYIVIPIGREVTPPEFVAFAIPREGEELPQQVDARNDAEHPAYYEAVSAIDEGDSDKLKTILQAHPDVVKARGYLDEDYEHRHFRGATLLHHIAGHPMRAELRNSVVGMAQLLLEAGADPSAITIDSVGTLSLVYDSAQARWLGIREALIEILLEAGADPNERHGYLLWKTIKDRADTLAHVFIEHGGVPDLRVAAALNLDSMDSFFAQDGSLLPHSHGGHRPYHPRLAREPAPDEETLGDAMTFATRRGYQDVVGYLLDRGADIHAVSPRFFWEGDAGVTLLHHAVDIGNLEMIGFLLDRGADPTRKDMWDNTALDWAKWSDEKEEIAQFLEKAIAETGQK